MKELVLEKAEHRNMTIFKVKNENLRKACNMLFFKKNMPLRTVVCTDERKVNGHFTLRYMFEGNGKFSIVETQVDDRFPSVSRSIPAANWYEREIKDMFGLVPEGHPDPRPLFLFPENYPEDFHPLRKDCDLNLSNYDFNPRRYSYKQVEGEGIFEMLVGPIHAGIIEPGHFRFSLIGEPIINLEIRHGWNHKGIEKLFESRTYKEGVKLSEVVSGDSSFSHSLAFISAVEDLMNVTLPEKAVFIRMLFSELERFNNHVSDFGFIFGEIGYSFGTKRAEILREKLLRLNKLLCGSRFLKGINRIGGVNVDITDDKIKAIREGISSIYREFLELVRLTENSADILDRYETTGKIRLDTVKELSLVGIVARASGLKTDTRANMPYLNYADVPFDIMTMTEGDAYARAMLRTKEAGQSIRIMDYLLSKIENLKGKAIYNNSKSNPKPYDYAVSSIEGHRGNITYFVMAGEDDKPFRVKVRDPSFVNWQSIQLAVLGDIVADFPLINKSMNLSYAGNDL